MFQLFGYDEETPSNSHLFVLSKGISNETNADSNKDTQVCTDTEGDTTDDGTNNHRWNQANLYDPCVGEDSTGVCDATQTLGIPREMNHYFAKNEIEPT